MYFATNAIGVFAADIERVAIDRRIAESILMPARRFLCDFGKADAADAARRAGKIAGYETIARPMASKICAPQ